MKQQNDFYIRLSDMAFRALFALLNLWKSPATLWDANRNSGAGQRGLSVRPRHLEEHRAAASRFRDATARRDVQPPSSGVRASQDVLKFARPNWMRLDGPVQATHEKVKDRIKIQRARNNGCGEEDVL